MRISSLTQVDSLSDRLKQLETRAAQLDGGWTSDATEAAVKAAEQLLNKLEDNSGELRGDAFTAAPAGASRECMQQPYQERQR